MGVSVFRRGLLLHNSIPIHTPIPIPADRATVSCTERLESISPSSPKSMWL